MVVDVLFLVLSPHEPPEPHLETVAQIANLVRDQSALDRLRAADGPQAAHRILAESRAG